MSRTSIKAQRADVVMFLELEGESTAVRNRVQATVLYFTTVTVVIKRESFSTQFGLKSNSWV